jgi:UDP-sulfoquinovose synthase
MKILVLGANGYTGEPISKYLADHGHEIIAIDNYYKVKLMKRLSISPLVESASMNEAFLKRNILPIEANISSPKYLQEIIRIYEPEAVIHLAQQPSAPYSMAGEDQAFDTMFNNLGANMRLIYAVLQNNPDIHIIKLGTLGEWGTPNTAIPEGWFDCEYKGRTDRMLFPKKPHSMYHLSKVHDSDALAFAARVWGLRVTDLNQGVVYGNYEDNRFTYDGMFGTVLNRFITQAIAGIPLTVYGSGGQTRGMLHIKDTLQCIELAVNNPAEPGEFRVFNQFTEQFSVQQIAEKVKNAAQDLRIHVNINHIDNPRSEMENHFYEADHTGLLDLGLQPHYLDEVVIQEMLIYVQKYKDNINRDQIMPKVTWKEGAVC